MRRAQGEFVDDRLFGLRFRYDLAGAADRKALFAIDRYDAEERRLINAHLPAGGVFADIGAALGQYALCVAANRPDVMVLAFEPVAATFRRLQYNIALNQLEGRVRPFNVALGDRIGAVAFDSATTSAASGHGDIMVPVETLVARLAAEGIERLDAIKIDVEGYEDRILAPFFASSPAISWPRLIVIEHAVRQGWQIDCLELLRRLGYSELWRGSLNAAFLRQPDQRGLS